MIVKLLTEHHLKVLSFKGGCRSSSESTLVKMWNCWKSHAGAQSYLCDNFYFFTTNKTMTFSVFFILYVCYVFMFSQFFITFESCSKLCEPYCGCKQSWIDNLVICETMTHIRMILKHFCFSGMLGIIQSKITWFILLPLLCSMSIITPNSCVKSIIFPQIWQRGAFPKIAGKALNYL